MKKLFSTLTQDPNLQSAFEQSQHFLVKVLEILPSTVYVFDLETESNIFSNRGITDDLGYTPEEILMFGPGLIGQLMHPEDLARYPKHLEALRTLQDGEQIEFEYRMRHRNGQWRWILSRESAFLRQAGRIKQIIGSATEITDRRVIENALRESEEFSRSIFESSPDCVKVLDPQGRFMAMNTQGMCLMEIDDFSAFIGEEWISVWPEAVRPKIDAALSTARQGGVGGFQGFCPTSKGTSKWWDVVVSRVLGSDGQLNRFISVSRDITDRMALENTAKDALDRLELGLESALAGWWEWDIERNRHYWSMSFEHLLGLKEGQFEGNPDAFLARLHPEDEPRIRAIVYADTNFSTGHPREYEYRVLLEGDAVRWVVSRSKIEHDAQGKPIRIIGVDMDITERKTTEERLRTINESQKRFVADASHELRAPLTSIQGNLELVIRYPEMDKADRDQALQDARDEAQRMSRLVGDLLALARGEASHQKRNPIHLDRVLESGWRSALTLSNEHRFELGTLESAFVLGDADQLKQLAVILLDNAIKYTPDGGRIHLECHCDHKHVEFCVTDSGQGIPLKDQPRIFDRFYRAVSTDERSGGPSGSGLGLTIAKRIIEFHNGEISLESEVGRGTRVKVKLLLCSEEPEGLNTDS